MKIATMRMKAVTMVAEINVVLIVEIKVEV